MNVETIIEDLQIEIHRLLLHRDDKISAYCRRNINLHQKLAEISRNMELLIADSRKALCRCYDEISSFGYAVREMTLSYPIVPEIDVKVDEKSVQIIMDAMLPFPINGGVHFLHESLNTALLSYSIRNGLAMPLFTERCAVIFFHHYANNAKSLRHLRDYDNVEKRCITNVIARHFMLDDSPACYISMDILAPGDSNFTEIRIMTIPAFRTFIASGEIEYSPQKNISKNIPKAYQKTSY